MERDGIHRLDIFHCYYCYLHKWKTILNNNSTPMKLWSLLCIKWGLCLVWSSFELLNLSLVKMNCLFLGRNGVYLKINLKNELPYVLSVINGTPNKIFYYSYVLANILLYSTSWMHTNEFTYYKDKRLIC